MNGRLAIAGEVWSRNLGDPLLHHCLRHLVQAAGAGSASLDFDARDAFPRRSGTGQDLQLPAPLRAATWWGVRWPRRRGTWSRRLAGCSALLLGGGQILDPAGMRFPPRLAALGALAHAHGLPLALACCGVSPGWDAIARLHLAALPRPAAVLLRDADSAAILSGLRPDWPSATVAPDPAVWAGAAYGIAAERGPQAVIGLGIGGALREPAWWAAVVHRLREAGRHPLLFCNGSDADAADLAAVARATGAAAAAPPDTPTGLLRLLAGCSAVLSGRLHAGIAAFSLGIPALAPPGLAKAAAFWRTVGLPQRVLAGADPQLVANRLIASSDEPSDPSGLLHAAQAACAEAVSALVAACRRG